jgi:hypothetical protein
MLFQSVGWLQHSTAKVWSPELDNEALMNCFNSFHHLVIVCINKT